MEKLTLTSTYTQVSLYARLTVAGSADRPAGGKSRIQPDDGAPGDPAVARNRDGDSFTLSVEARTVQVSESITIEAEEGVGPGTPRCMPRPGGHPGYPRLSDPEDVASRTAEFWDAEHAARGGSRRDFAAGVRARLERWAAEGDGARRVAREHREFRSEVAMRISGRLEDWTAAGVADHPAPGGAEGPADPAAA